MLDASFVLEWREAPPLINQVVQVVDVYCIFIKCWFSKSNGCSGNTPTVQVYLMCDTPVVCRGESQAVRTAAFSLCDITIYMSSATLKYIFFPGWPWQIHAHPQKNTYVQIERERSNHYQRDKLAGVLLFLCVGDVHFPRSSGTSNSCLMEWASLPNSLLVVFFWCRSKCFIFSGN